jgi:hypothetical protein
MTYLSNKLKIETNSDDDGQEEEALHSTSSHIIGGPTTDTSSQSNDSPVIRYVRFPANRNDNTRRSFHRQDYYHSQQNQQHRRRSSSITSPKELIHSPSKTYFEIGECTVIEDEIFWEFKLPTLDRVNTKTGKRLLETNGRFSNKFQVASSSIDKLFFFGNRLWRITFGHHNVYQDYYFIFLSLAEHSAEDCFVHASFTIHPFTDTVDSDQEQERDRYERTSLSSQSRTLQQQRQQRHGTVVSFADQDEDDIQSVCSSISQSSNVSGVSQQRRLFSKSIHRLSNKITATAPYNKTSLGSFSFPAQITVSRGFEKFISMHDLQGYLSKNHLHPRIRLSILLRTLVDPNNRLLPV